MIGKMWNTFLDTTPRQWGQSVTSGLTNIFTRPASFPATSLGSMALFLSLAVHAGVYVVLAYGLHASSPIEDAGDVVEINIQTAGPVRETVEPVFDENSDIVMPAPPPKKKKTEAELKTEQLLARYQGIHVGAVKAENKDETTHYFRPHRQETPEPQQKLSESLMHAPEEKRTIKTPGLSKELSQHLARYQTQFQSCYERALLVDETLNGRIQFALKIGGQGQISDQDVQFLGAGQEATKSQMHDCLQSLVHGIRFPGTFAKFYGRTIRFQAVLSL